MRQVLSLAPIAADEERHREAQEAASFHTAWDSGLHTLNHVPSPFHSAYSKAVVQNLLGVDFLLLIF